MFVCNKMNPQVQKSHNTYEVIKMKKNKGIKACAADKVQLKGEGLSPQNQNQNHNTQKEAMGPNTKRQG